MDPINPKEDMIRFMCIDIDTYADKPPVYTGQNPKEQGKEISIIRLYGVNEKGNSMAIHIFNFRPYFYI